LFHQLFSETHRQDARATTAVYGTSGRTARMRKKRIGAFVSK
jgi:hypothetical protein